MLTRITVEAALNAELDDHLGYERRCNGLWLIQKNHKNENPKGAFRVLLDEAKLNDILFTEPNQSNQRSTE